MSIPADPKRDSDLILTDALTAQGAALDDALARATSAEQERDRLRARIEAALAECDRADEALSRQSRTGATFVHERVRALLAGAGEQPAPTALVRVEWGVVLDDLGSTDVYDTREEAEARAGRDSTVVRIETWRVGPGEQPGCECYDTGGNYGVCAEHAEGSRPAPVVPDSADVRDITDQVRYAWCWYGGATREESDRRAEQFDTWLASLTAVGQGVTAGCDDREPHTDCEPHLTVWADGATAEQREAIYEAAMGAAFNAAEGMDGVDVGGVGTLSDNRAAVRPTGQEQADG